MPDISLLPYIASFYDTTVDFLLGCDLVKKEEAISEFEAKVQALANKGKRGECVFLCRDMLKKYPNEIRVLYHLMYDLYSVDAVENSAEIIKIAERIMDQGEPEQRHGAIKILAYTYDSMGFNKKAVEYAKMLSVGDVLVSVLKGEELILHCKKYFFKLCGDLFRYSERLIYASEAEYSDEEIHAIRKSVYDIYSIIFSCGDFGFWDEYAGIICSNMAQSSLKLGNKENGLRELELMCDHFEKYSKFSNITHISPLVKGFEYDAGQSASNIEGSMYAPILDRMNNSEIFEVLSGDPRFANIKECLVSLC